MVTVIVVDSYWLYNDGWLVMVNHGSIESCHEGHGRYPPLVSRDEGHGCGPENLHNDGG